MNKIEPISFSDVKIVPKGWGKEIHIVNNEKYCGKILCFNKGSKFSAHYHILKSEVFYVLKGKLSLMTYDLTNADKIYTILEQGSVITIPAGNPHQLEALEESEIIEISTQHFDEDSYRVLPGDSQKR